MIKKFLSFFCCGLIFLMSCCKHTDNTPTPTVPVDTLYNTTPYTLNTPFYLSKYNIPVDNPLTKTGVKLGRMLFYEKSLSRDNSISCGSCHKQAFAFSDNQPFSKGVDGTLGVRSSMSLTNLVYFDSTFFWDGRAKSLEDQVHFPIGDQREMKQLPEDAVLKLQNNAIYTPLFRAAFNTTVVSKELVFKAIAQFERSLLSVNSKYDQYYLGTYILSAQEQRGKDLFLQHPYPTQNLRGGNCGDCHGGFLVTFNRFQNNGLDAIFADSGFYKHTAKAFDIGKFRVPSLRNIALTAPYMHDGRFKTLEEVLDHYNEHIIVSSTTDPLVMNATNNVGETANKLGLTDQEKMDIIAFLQLLTDETFISNSEFSDPFVK
jgi:cytochrome c peroxidase